MEKSVIDEKMLEEAVEEQGPKGEAKRIAMEEGIEFNKVLQLRLGFKNILKIEHLCQFKSLTKLQLNKNCIQNIEGLSSLTNLTWLDLSFNHIEKIEGLETLTKMEDLTLYNNKISCIENMDTLKNLTFFAIGNNSLEHLEDIMYMRRFNNLRNINLAGNPLSADENYKLFIAAYLPTLTYLDYRLLTEETKQQAWDKYQYAVEVIWHKEQQALKAMEAEQSQQEELQTHYEAFVEFLNGSYLFDSMIAEDSEAEKIGHIPGVAALVETYEDQLVPLCVQMFKIGLAEQKPREEEVNAFFVGLKEGVREKQQRSAQRVADFEKYRRKSILDLQKAPDVAQREALVKQYSEEIKLLQDSIMLEELQLVDQLEEMIEEFERNIQDMVANFCERICGIFSQCRDLELQLHEKIKDIALTTMEKLSSSQDLPDDVRALFVEKDILMDAVTTSHVTHMLKIDNREDTLVTRTNGWMQGLIERIKDEEVWRNRNCISEIQHYIKLRNQMQDLPIGFKVL